MREESRFVDVSLFGKEYRVACPQDQREDLRTALALVDAKMREVAHKTRSGSTERIAVMAALNLAHEHLISRREQEQLAKAAAEQAASEIKSAAEKAASEIAAAKKAGLDFDDVRRRIGDMEALLGVAIEPPEEAD